MKQPKYKVGDVVYGATSYKKSIEVQCPDCLGKGVWCVKTPSGQESTIPCYTCERGFDGCPGKIIQYQESPRIEKLTIGSVRIDTNEEHPISYMCKETGVGSGTIHNEDKLFLDRVEALNFATEKAKKIVRAENERQRKILELGKKRSRKNPTKD